MTSFKPMAALCALAWTLSPVLSEAADDVAALRTELQTLKDEYAKRVGALEARIQQLETAADAAAALAAAPEAAAPPAPSASPYATPQRGGAASAFNPAISLILGGTYVDTKQDPEGWRIGGFMPSGGEVGPGERSFNLGESELAVSASVDPYFTAIMIAALTAEGEVEVEEAYFRTLALPEGFTLKGGRFFSGFGYLNEQHSHVWDFVDQPLVYQALWGNQFRQDGLQLRWLAPSELFVELGAEAGNGGEFPGTRRNRNGMNGGTLFAHVGGDIGDSTSWRAGASWSELHSDNRTYEDTNEIGEPVLNAFTGTSRTWVVDAVLKWAPHGNVTRQQLKLQGEYMRRTERGQLAFDTEGLALSDGYESEQSGWYLQSVYQFMPRWRVGLRYDRLDSGTPTIDLVRAGLLSPGDFPALLAANPERVSIMFDWNPSEFSRLRAQYDWDDARSQGDQDRTFRLQYIYGIGAHGAHKY